MSGSTSAASSGGQAWASPMEMGARWAEIAGKSQAALDTFLRKQASDQPQVVDLQSTVAPFSELLVSMMSNPTGLVETQLRLWQSYGELWQNVTLRAFGVAAGPVAAPKKADRRFKHEKWESDVVFDYIKQSYLIASESLQQMIAAHGEKLSEPARAKLRFYVQQYVDAMSPTNFAATNPEVIGKTWQTGGDNLLKGLSNLLDDLSADKGIIRRRAPDAYKVGENLAATKGSVVFRNDLMELIQYEPTTETVHEVPILLVPPWVNKFYLFDLQPKNSFIKWLVDQGFTVFAISWVNPGSAHAGKDFEDYFLEGPLAAFDVIEATTGQSRTNLVGYCLGGTLTATGLAYLAEKGEESRRVASATLIATLVDYTRLGEFEVFIDKEQVEALDRAMETTGYLDARDLGRLFSVVRANDLIWSLVIGNYLLAEEAVPFDMLTWFADGARMPAKMVKTFLNRVALENALARAGALNVAGTPIDLGKIRTPTCIVAMKDDHVAAWESAYNSTQLIGGTHSFILGGSGHNAGVINPPSQGKFGFWTSPDLRPTAEEWLGGATKNEGSWWPHWASWVGTLSGSEVGARTPGSEAFPPIEPAPGSYVRATG